MRYYVGVDIGGTKCAVTLGCDRDGELTVLEKSACPTKGAPEAVLERFLYEINDILKKRALSYADIACLGISCGGPLDAARGIVQSPPNLPGWDHVCVTEFFKSRTGIPSFLENDANACAVAEWKYGAGKGKKNVIFLTFGTGLGAGLILNGRLYSGANGNAGEIGHVRLRADGPIGYGKAGSAEGFCSGGGLAQQGRMAAERDPAGASSLLAYAGGLDGISAKSIAELAERGDGFCIELYRRCGEMLGETLSILIDLLNPERIILGGVYMRAHKLLEEGMRKILSREALSFAVRVCEILPAELGEQIGDFAALSLAAYNDQSNQTM